jgi:hypothetical protein
MLSPKTLRLLFYQQNESIARFINYWQTIFPGSKRYLAESGLVGDNTDVRPPGDDEKSRGVIGAVGGGGGGSSREPIRQITLALDSILALISALRVFLRIGPPPGATGFSPELGRNIVQHQDGIPDAHVRIQQAPIRRS